MSIKEKIWKWLKADAEKEGYFPVECEISSRKAISVYVDSLQGITIENCVKISRALYEYLGSELDAYSLVVSSSGLDRPLVVPQQFIKNIGKKVQIWLNEGPKLEGTLQSYTEKEILVEVAGVKKKDPVVTHTLPLNEIKEVKLVISFK